MLDVLNADYVRTARAKGVPRRQVIIRSTRFRNALIPFVTVIALDTAFLFGGVIITEQIFSIAGHGAGASSTRSAPATRRSCWPGSSIGAVAVIGFNLLADVVVRRARSADPAVVTRDPSTAPARGRSTTRDLAPGAAARRAHATGSCSGGASSATALALVSIVVLAILMVACFGAPWLAPYKQNAQNLLRRRHGPERQALVRHRRSRPRPAHPRSCTPDRSRSTIGLAVALLSTVVGVAVGAVAGYFGRATDQALSGFTDLFLVLPDSRCSRSRCVIFGRKLHVDHPRARRAGLDVHGAHRAGAGAVAEGEGVRRGGARRRARRDRASSSGTSSRTAIGTIMVNATLAVAAAISTEAALSFLGFGIQPPQNSWGHMLTDAESYATSHVEVLPHLVPRPRCSCSRCSP